MLKEIDKEFLIGRWWTHYIRYWDADLALKGENNIK